MNALITPRATRREWLGLAVLALPCLLYSMDLTILNLVLPSLAVSLRPSSVELLWIIDIYGFFVAAFLVPLGALGDRFGRRRVLLFGAFLFAATSALAALATSPPWVIAARACMGLAGASLAPSTLSLIRTLFRDARDRTVAVGVWIASYSLGGALGPLVGGVLLAHFPWQAVFLVPVPVMLSLLVLGPRLLPEARDPTAAPVDLPSIALSLAAVLLGVGGVKNVAVGGLTPGPSLSLFAAGLLALLLVRRQRGLDTPLVDLDLFRNPVLASEPRRGVRRLCPRAVARLRARAGHRRELGAGGPGGRGGGTGRDRRGVGRRNGHRLARQPRHRGVSVAARGAAASRHLTSERRGGARVARRRHGRRPRAAAAARSSARRRGARRLRRRPARRRGGGWLRHARERARVVVRARRSVPRVATCVSRR